MTPEKSDFLLKYGDGKHIDKMMRIDHPEWPGRDTAWNAIMPAMYHTASMALKNPAISNKAAAKAASLPHNFTPNIMFDYLRDKKDVHPDVLTVIAKHNGHMDYIRSMLAERENMPKEAWTHLAKHIHNRLNSDDSDEFLKNMLEDERDFYLKKAQ